MDANYADLVTALYDTTVTKKQKLPPELFAQLDAAIQEYQKTAPR